MGNDAEKPLVVVQNVLQDATQKEAAYIAVKVEKGFPKGYGEMVWVIYGPDQGDREATRKVFEMWGKPVWFYDEQDAKAFAGSLNIGGGGRR